MKKTEKFHFSGHETFPLRQLWLKKSVDYSKSSENVNFDGEDAMIALGVGANMVRSMRFWALQTDFLEACKGKGLSPTPLANLLFGDKEQEGIDPYGEHPSLSWLVHWKLASRSDRLSIFWFLFNIENQTKISRQRLLEDFVQYIGTQEVEKIPSEGMLKRDVEVCLRSYVPASSGRGVGKITEELIEPLLGDLNLIEAYDRDTFSIHRGVRPTLNNALFAWTLLDYWDNLSEGVSQVSSLDFMRIAHGIGSPGKVFRISEANLTERLESLEELTGGMLAWTEQSGIRNLIRRISSESDRKKLSETLLREAFNE